jgi:carboxypeptidase Q
MNILNSERVRPFLHMVLGLSVWCCFSFTGDKQDAPDLHAIARMKQEGFNNSKVMEILFELTDLNGPRLTGSTGMRNAEKWAVAKLSTYGMDNPKTEPWGTFGKGWETNKCYVAMTIPYYQQLIAVPKAWTPGTEGAVKGKAVLVKIDSVADMANYISKLSGKIAVIPRATNENKLNFSADARRLSDSDLLKIATDPHLDETTASTNLKTKPAAAKPNLRMLIDSFLFSENALAVVSNGRGGTMGTVFTTNGASRAWNTKPVLPELEMSTEHINRLTRLLDANIDVALEIESRNIFLTTDSTESNVIAEIPGTDPKLKSELVLLGAHMDSWHAGTGTTDNGTGSAVMMEAMRILKACGFKPRRTIRLVLWSGEEQGLLGSRGYVKNHFANRQTMELKPEHEKVSAYFNLDNGGGKIRGIYMQGNDEVRPIFESWLSPFRDLGATTISIRNTGATDHVSFDEVGIPGFQFIQDPLDYDTRTHHTNMDVYERASAPDLMQASVIIASMVYHTAMREEKLPRKMLPVVK